ncbi:hypothetical protein TorRG33x02_356570 [Trema orientale]|uniref:Uncharacterized protein n=1 Tax=Trema orientale TaxID=63057 RepID=A0A2P5A6X3_TREOI|nr:hypothetical protein TorRG33x02_356570 [Trema orientale]
MERHHQKIRQVRERINGIEQRRRRFEFEEVHRGIETDKISLCRRRPLIDEALIFYASLQVKRKEVLFCFASASSTAPTNLDVFLHLPTLEKQKTAANKALSSTDLIISSLRIEIEPSIFLQTLEIEDSLTLESPKIGSTLVSLKGMHRSLTLFNSCLTLLPTNGLISILKRFGRKKTIVTRIWQVTTEDKICKFKLQDLCRQDDGGDASAINAMESQLNKLLQQEEFCRQRSQIQWLDEGDNNLGSSIPWKAGGTVTVNGKLRPAIFRLSS